MLTKYANYYYLIYKNAKTIAKKYSNEFICQLIIALMNDEMMKYAIESLW